MTHDPRLDDLRRQLQSLGYLNAGVDRFVLGPARSARRPRVIAALAALRVGVIAAVLLGPAVAVGIGTRLPGLVTGPRDAAVVALYLGALFGLAVSVFTFIASVTVARFAGVARRARLLSRVAGSLVAIGCLVYLTLWWRSANAGLAWSAPGWTAFALGIAVAISLLLGHAVAITAFAVIAAGRAGTGPSESPSSSGWWLSIVAGLAAFAGAAALLVLTAPASSSSGPEGSPPPLAVVSAGVRVKLIAIDGFDPKVFDRLAAEGRLPALATLLAAGRVQVEPDELRDPARAWVTIATGQLPQVHGVHGLETRRVAGLKGAVASGDERGLGRAIRGATDLMRLTRPSVASGSELRAKTVWEIAADAGLRAAVVNWWATWPAGTGPNEPTVISDRGVLRLERGGTLDAEIAPAQLYETLRAEWPAITTESAALVRASMPATTDPFTTTALGRSAELDALQLALAARLQSEAPDLLAVYLPGLDIAQHTLLASGSGASPSAMAARLDGLRAYYVFLDAVLKDVIVPRKDELIVLVTQPGRLSPDVQGLAGVAGAAAATRIDADARGVDLAPTILHAVGIPVSRDLAGTPLVGLFSADFIRTFPVRYVPTYGPRSSRSSLRKGQPLDQEMIDRLRSLGYVR